MNIIDMDLQGNSWIEGQGAIEFNFQHPTILRVIGAMDTENKAWVYDPGGTLRAAQSSKESALHYMTENRILIFKRKRHETRQRNHD